MDYSSVFSLRAEAYALASRRFSSVREQELRVFAAALNVLPGETLLDAPAGPGMLRAYLPESCNYLALEPTEAFVQRCRHLGLATIQASLGDSGLADASCDVIGSLTGLHHEWPRSAIYHEWFRLLRPDGRLVVMDVEASSPVAGLLNGVVDMWNSQGHKGHFLAEQDLQSLRLAGFEVQAATDCSYAWHAEDSADMAMFMSDLFGLDQAPSHEVLLAALSEELDAGQTDEGYRVPWSLRLIHAHKPLI